MPKGETDFWDIEGIRKYTVKLYYSILLVTGNDVMPSTLSEFQFCTLILFIGAFLEAYIIGGITAEMG